MGIFKYFLKNLFSKNFQIQKLQTREPQNVDSLCSPATSIWISKWISQESFDSNAQIGGKLKDLQSV